MISIAEDYMYWFNHFAQQSSYWMKKQCKGQPPPKKNTASCASTDINNQKNKSTRKKGE